MSKKRLKALPETATQAKAIREVARWILCGNELQCEINQHIEKGRPVFHQHKGVLTLYSNDMEDLEFIQMIVDKVIKRLRTEN